MIDRTPRTGTAGAYPSSVRSVVRGRRLGLLLALLFTPMGLIGNVQPAEAGQRMRLQGVDRPTHRPVGATAPRRTAPTVAPRQLEPARKAWAAAAPGPTVLAALQRAEAATGTDAALLFAIARRESGFKAGAHSRNSSARGLMQFTSSTWLEVVRDYGPRHGLAGYAAILASVPRGRLPADRHVITELLRLRDDPHLASALAAERLDGWRGTLEQALGREANGTDLYLVHLLGPAGARRFLSEMARAPHQRAGAVVGAAARANHAIFVRNGRHLSLSEVYRDLAASLATDAADNAAVRQQEAIQVAAAG